LHFARSNNSNNNNQAPFPYYVATVLHSLAQAMPDNQIWGRGLRVYTNLDQSAQRQAEDVLNRGIYAAPHGINQGALVCESVRDGGILALVGGVGDYRNHQFNRALAPHTVGSAFKPFVYLAAAIRGVLQPASSIDDSPVTFNTGFGQQYTPKNFDGKFLGPISVRDALALSRNVCAIRVADAVGIKYVIETARAAGITASMDQNLSLALGSCAVSPVEMATSYATLARDGEYIQASLIRRVDDAEGNRVTEFPPKTSQVLPQEQVHEVVDVMCDVVQRGTGVQAKLKNIAVAGKTGTADKARDIWFVGFTPDTVTAVWGGNDRYLPVRGNVTGGVVMAKIWHDFMTDFYHNHPAPTGSFAPPQTPFMQQATASINSSLVKDAQQYEEGLKNSAEPGADATNQPEQNADGSAGIAFPDPVLPTTPPLAPSIPSASTAPSLVPGVERIEPTKVIPPDETRNEQQAPQHIEGGSQLEQKMHSPDESIMPAPAPAPTLMPAPAPAPSQSAVDGIRSYDAQGQNGF
jgi:membrane peptidoglycan carboxypeptidase